MFGFAFSEMAKDKYLLILILFCLDWEVGNDHQFEYLATYFDTKGQKLSLLNESSKEGCLGGV